MGLDQDRLGDFASLTTDQLLKRLREVDSSPDDRELLHTTLGDREDPKSFAPLEAILVDLSLSQDVRATASGALSRMGYGEMHSAEQLRSWWHHDDPVLSTHAVRTASEDLRDLLAQRIAETDHPLRWDAIQRAGLLRATPHLNRALLACIDDDDPAVREAALEAVYLGDTPAESLLPAIERMGDAEEDVASAAAMLVSAHECPRALRAMHAATQDPRTSLAREARVYIDDLRFSLAIETRRNEAVRRHLEAWFGDAWELVRPVETVDSLDDSSPDAALPDVNELLGLLSQRGPDRSRGWPYGDEHAWMRYTRGERRLLTEIMLRSDDPRVRAYAPQSLAYWGERDALFLLLEDRSRAVREAAVSALHCLRPRDPELAQRIRGWLESPPETWMRGGEAVEAYAAHAERTDWGPVLLAVALDETRSERTRMLAIDRIVQDGRLAEIEPLQEILERPPVASWQLHADVLNALLRCGLEPRTLDVVREAEDLDTQIALVPFLS